MTVQQFFSAPLRPIPFKGVGQKPLWAAESYDPDNLVGISERFLEHADIYTETYTHSENIVELLGLAFRQFAIDPASVRDVLDFGSGPGTNTIFPLHQVAPDSRIVATDISLPLLATLSRLLDTYPQQDKIDVVAWDCMSGGIVPGSFDLVTGVSLLHHLMDPELALATAYEALQPGGYALFIDPYDGASLIRGLYQVLLIANVGRNDQLSPETIAALEVLSKDYQIRLAGTKPEDFEHLEDKWIFSQEWMVQKGLDAGFSSVRYRANHSYPTVYRDYVLIQLRMAGGPAAGEVPTWAMDILEAFAGSMTPAVRKRMLLEATVVMQK